MVFLKVLTGVGVTAVALVLALPLGEQAYLGWGALVPLLVAVRNRGFLAGFVAALGAVFLAAWVASTGLLYVDKEFGGEVSWIYTGMGLFGFALAFTVALWADPKLGRKPVWWFAAAAVLLEACLLIQLPAHMALTQYREPVPLELASVGGIWAVSFLLWLCNAWLARLPWGPLLWWSAAIACVSLVLHTAWRSVEGTPKRYAAIQTDSIEPSVLFSLHRVAARESPSFVVWPEFSALDLASEGTDRLIAFAKTTPAPFVTTFRDRAMPLPHNAAALFSPWGESERYFKRKPFGAETQMHAPGDRAAAAVTGSSTVGLNICFDSCHPSVMRDTARLPGVQAIALPTIDPPAPHHFMAAMHAAYSPFRAAELGVAIVRADGAAYSSIVDARGKIVAEASPGPNVIVAEAAPGPRFTVYREWGDWFLYVCGALVLVGGFVSGKGSPRDAPD